MRIKKIMMSGLFVVAACILFSSVVFSQDNSGQDGRQVSDNENIQVLKGDILDILPEPVRKFMEIRILEYPLWRIVLAITIVIFGFFFERLIHSLMKLYTKKLKKVKTEDRKIHFIRSSFSALRRPVRLFVWAGLIRLMGYVIVQEHVTFAVWIADILVNLAIVVFLYDFVETLEEFLMGFVQKTETKVDDMLVPIIRNGLRIIVIALAVVHIIQRISGQNITSILAGLGIAGMAVALAAQDTIKNFFGFIMIALDQPFKVGERIDFNGHDGIIEEIGLRSTKMRRLDGHMVTIPNMKAADDIIHNIGRRENIRRIINIGITYDTEPEKIQQAVGILKDILDNHEGMKDPLLPQVFFNDMKADSLNIFAIYWYHPPAYWDYMKHCQYINMEIIRRFNEAEIEFAFPTQTIQMQMDNQQLQLITQMEQKAGE